MPNYASNILLGLDIFLNVQGARCQLALWYFVLFQEYIYDTSVVKKSKTTGQRLVGAGRGNHFQIPFVVVFDPYAKDDKNRNARCTGDNKIYMYSNYLTDSNKLSQKTFHAKA